jgi:hypothetical protein
MRKTVRPSHAENVLPRNQGFYPIEEASGSQVLADRIVKGERERNRHGIAANPLYIRCNTSSQSFDHAVAPNGSDCFVMQRFSE